MQKLIVEEMVAAINALTREALCEAFKVVFASNAAVTALRNTEALGPLRAILAPIPTPLGFLSDMGSRVSLTSEDRHALDTVSLLLDMLGDGSDLSSQRKLGSSPHSTPPSVSLLEMIDDMHRTFTTGAHGTNHFICFWQYLVNRNVDKLTNTHRWHNGARGWRSGTHSARDSPRSAVHRGTVSFQACSEVGTEVC